MTECKHFTNEEVDSCKLHVEFKSIPSKRIAEPDNHPKVQCPVGYEVVGTTCYKLVWPGDVPDTMMGVNEGLS